MDARALVRLPLRFLVVTLLLVAALPSPTAHAASLVFTVTSVADTSDGVCDASCTLREAVNAANVNVGRDVIGFNIGGGGPVTIRPTSALPQIVDSIVVDGTTQPGFAGTPVVELDGSSAGSANGLQVTAPDSEIRGLIVNRFALAGIRINSPRGLVRGNYVGTNVTGTVALGNARNGVELSGTTDTVVGGSADSDRNVISGNSVGVYINGSGNRVLGNYIGTNAGGTDALPNQNGVQVIGGFAPANDNIIGGPAAGEGNVISGNTNSGILLNTFSADRTQRNVIAGNRIGTQADGVSPLGNGDGVVFASFSGIGQNTVGGTTPASANVITHNTRAGVSIATSASQNRVIGNRITMNGGLGIDHGGDGIPNSTANNGQTFPVLTEATSGASSVSIKGTLASAPSSTYRVEFYQNDACDASGYGEGQQLLGTTDVTTDASGNVSFTASFATTVETGRVVTATATDALGNTSEFSACRAVAGEAPSFTVNSTDDTDGACTTTNCTLRAAITRSNATPGRDTIDFAIPGPAPHTITLASPLPEIIDPAVVDAAAPTGAPNACITTPLVRLDGNAAGADTNGLVVSNGDTLIRGFDIVGFRGSGVVLRTGGGNTVEGNLLRENGVGGVYVASPDNVVRGNTIVRNARRGVFVSSTRTVIGGSTAAARNVISANGMGGIYLGGATDTTIKGNYIGTNCAGTGPDGNGGPGIFAQSTARSIIGGATPGERNVISANAGGVLIYSSDPFLAPHGNVIKGNYVGVDVTGQVAMLNDNAGYSYGRSLDLDGSADNVIGGTESGAGNVLVGNVRIATSTKFSAERNVVQGNMFGTNHTGDTLLHRSQLVLEGSSNNLIGGTDPAARNVLQGVTMIATTLGNGTVTRSDFNVVQGNYIGTDVSGSAAFGGEGVVIRGSSDNVIGGADPAARNVISGNSNAGVSISAWIGDDSARRNLVQGNFIGTAADGVSPLGNTWYGVFVDGGTNSRNYIGGTTAQAGNVIAHNRNHGVAIGSSDGSIGVRGNSIHNNRPVEGAAAGLGIWINGQWSEPYQPTRNNSGAEDDVQNFPVLSRVSAGASSTEMEGTLHTRANASYVIEFFGNDTCDPSGYGEGQRLLGSTTVTTDANGDASFTATVNSVVQLGEPVTSTATPASVVPGTPTAAVTSYHTTSEFSSCVGATEPPIRPAQLSGQKFNDVDGDGVRDAGESGLSDWTIRAYIDADANGWLDSTETTQSRETKTGLTGSYALSLQPGSYVLCEVNVANWVQTAPNPAEGECGSTVGGLASGGHAVTVGSGEVVTAVDFGNQAVRARISGVKFNDLDGNGARGASEPGLGDWEIRAYVDTNADGVLSPEESTLAGQIRTGADGGWQLSLPPGTYVVCEATQPNWVQTAPAAPRAECGTETAAVAPGGHAVEVGPGEVMQGKDFGNRAVPASVSGTKFDDVDGDGTRAVSGERGLSDWTVRAYVDADANGVLDSTETTVADEATTSVTGSYSLSLRPGSYVLCEVNQPKWTQTAPAPGEIRCGNGLAALAPGGHAITVTPAQVHSGLDFGNQAVPTRVSGVKFNDVDGDGVRATSGEPGLEQWTIRAYVDADANGVLDSTETTLAAETTTSGTGAYSMSLRPGSYVLCEANQTNWVQTAPSLDDNRCGNGIAELAAGGHPITATPGGILDNLHFGNQLLPARVTGVKYNDVDGDGVRAASGEPGLENWTIRAYLDSDANGVLDSTETQLAREVLTGSTGAYSLSLRAGSYVLCEMNRPTWAQTAPAPLDNRCGNGVAGLATGGHAITVAAAEVSNGKDFGNQAIPARVSGVKFNDVDGDGVWALSGEPGLTGWWIRAYVDTDANGVLDPSDTTWAAETQTRADGSYALRLRPGSYVLCEVTQPNWVQTAPAPGDGECGTTIGGLARGGHALTVVAGEVVGAVDFGNQAVPARVTGLKYEDRNGDGVHGSFREPGLGGWTIRAYVDADSNGVLDSTERLVAKQTTTDPDGNYTLLLRPGSYVLCEVNQHPWLQAAPAPGDNACGNGLPELAPGGHAITVDPGGLVENLDFGNQDDGPALEISKVEQDCTPAPCGPSSKSLVVEFGDTVAYTLVVRNVGRGAATNVALLDAIPSGLTVLDISAPSGVSCAATSLSLRCDIATLPARTDVEVRVMTRVSVTPSPCTIVGTSGNDTIVGTPSRDVICGLGGSDTIDAAGGDDLVYGDIPPGFAVPGPFVNLAWIDADNDGAADADELQDATTASVQAGAPAGDRLVGGDGGDEMLGQEGDDTVLGGLGWDRLNGNDGNDVVNGEGDHDTVSGDLGSDRVFGAEGDDQLFGDVLNPWSDSIGQPDFVSGGPGNDHISGQGGDDNAAVSIPGGTAGLFGGDGTDTIFGGDGNDSLDGGAANDQLNGDNGDDVLFGGTGRDLISGNSGHDTLYGDVGRSFDAPGEPDSLNGGTGNDTLFGQGGNDHGSETVLFGLQAGVFGGAGDDVANGGNGNDGVFGNDGHDRLLGGDGNDHLSGNNGNDTIFGQDGADIVFGDAGFDEIYGQEGPDQLFGHGQNDMVDGGGDNDLVDGGADDDNLFGGAGRDHVFGASGSDRAYGDIGTDPDGWGEPDRVDGGAGNDSLYGQGGDDNDTELARGGVAAGLFGSSGNDFISGGGGGDDLRGGADSDELRGGNGRDRLAGDDGTDRDATAGAADLLIGEGDDDLLLGQGGNDGWCGSTSACPAIVFTVGAGGHEAAAELQGGRGVDYIHGGVGNDRLNGGPIETGNVLYGAAGTDYCSLGPLNGPAYEGTDRGDIRDATCEVPANPLSKLNNNQVRNYFDWARFR